MDLIVKLIGIVVVVYGCVIVLRPSTLKKILEFGKEEKNIYIGSGIKIVFGVLLMLAASSCLIPWVVMFWGALTAFGGVAVFIIKKNVILDLMNWVEKLPPRKVYYLGAFALIVGVSLALAA